LTVDTCAATLRPVNLRRRVALELSTLAVLTALYLLAVPHRPIWLDAGLGLAAVVMVLATARHTRERIWAPPAMARRDRLRHSARHMLVATSAAVLLFAIVGRPGSLSKATMLGALVLFTPWAALQQALFQLYLLGRLRALLPASPPLTVAALNGALFGAVHLPDVELAALTGLGGAVWSWYYVRDRCLGPIAVSHAVLGTTYYYWIRGEDLLLRWLGAARL
jgi:membrane protease YdiL (CAAX protease family)